MNAELHNHLEGHLASYCPLLLERPKGAASEYDDCMACYSWKKAEALSGHSLKRPILERDTVKIPLFEKIDILLSQRKILCVEDNPVSMKVLLKSLGPLSEFTYLAKDGVEAIETINNQSDQVGLILLDMDMPNMDGLEFLNEYHNNFGPPTCPIMLVSELSSWDKAKQALELGVLGYVKKPFKKEELYENIVNVMFSFRENIS